MKTALCSALAFGTCISVALAESLPADGAKDGATTEAHAAGPVALTEAEMDKITGGQADMFMKIGDIKGESADTTYKDWIGRTTSGLNVLTWSWGAAPVSK